MRVRIIAAASIVIILTAGQGYPQDLYVGKDGNIRNIAARAMAIDSGGGYLATRGELYRAGDGISGEKWEEIFSLPPGENEISSLAINARSILIGTKRGIYKSDDSGQSWRGVFRTIMPDKNNINSIESSGYNPKRVIVGTMRGVFLSEDFGSRWTDISANLRNKPVKQAVLNKDKIYALAEGGLFVKGPGQSAWERVYVNSAIESGNDSTDETAYSQDTGYENEVNQSIGSVTIKGARLYLGVNKKIVYSDNDGIAWSGMSDSGLSGTVNYILLSKKSARLYCATTRGVYEFDEEKRLWKELYKGIDRVLSVTSLVFCSEDEKALWGLTENGLYRFEPGAYSLGQYGDIEKGFKTFKIIFEGEPSFRELRQAAITYCDVSPDKIKSWQRNSRIKALVPKLSFGVGKDISSNTEIYTSATRDYSVVGPEDYSNNLDCSISWELGNLIWSSDQTTIDVRSRLNTQLRNDILDDLRRLYYERKRLQFELVSMPAKDMRVRFDREMRVQELTQAIDDLTGNYLSDHMKKKE